MNIRRLLSRSTSCVMDLYSRLMYSRSFDAEYRDAGTFLAQHPQPELSQADKDEIDSYWRQFGIRFPDHSWHQMFYGVTGIHDPRFIPDCIAFPPIYRHYNDRECIVGWDDKNLYDRLVPNITFPQVLAHIYKGKAYDKDWHYCAPDDLDHVAASIFNETGASHSIIIKATRGSQAGKGVRVIEVNSPDEVKALILHNLDHDYVLQQRLVQSEFMSQFCSTSVNIFRIMTWRHQGEIKVLSTSIRYGVEGFFTDVVYIKGEEIVHTVGVNDDGTVNERFISLRGREEKPEHYHDRHIPNYQAVIDMAKRGHEMLLPFDLVGWDITLDQDNYPVCIEYNISRPGTQLYQFANGPFAGALTDEFLAFLKQENNLKRFIPAKYRI